MSRDEALPFSQLKCYLKMTWMLLNVTAMTNQSPLKISVTLQLTERQSFILCV